MEDKHSKDEGERFRRERRGKGWKGRKVKEKVKGTENVRGRLECKI